MTNSEEVVQELTVKVAARKDHYCNFIDDCQSVIKPHKVVYRYVLPSDEPLFKGLCDFDVRVCD